MPLLLLLALSTTATPPPRVAESVVTQLHVQPDGSLSVHETLTIRNHNPHSTLPRTLPLTHLDPRGVPHRVRIQDLQITDDAGSSLPYQSSADAHHLTLQIGDPNVTRTGLHTVHLRYTLLRAFTPHDGSDQPEDLLRWPVTGPDWELPVRLFQLDVVLPPDLPPNTLRVEGHRTTTAPQLLPTRWTDPHHATLLTSIGPGHTLHLEVALPSGYLARPTPLQRLQWWADDHRAALWLWAAPAFLFVLWSLRRLWVLAPLHALPRPADSPPDSLSPLLVGVLIDDHLDPIDVAAHLLDLARRGHVSLRRHGPHLVFRRTTRTRNLSPLDKAVLTSVFASRGTAQIDHFTSHQAADRLRTLEDTARLDLHRAGLLRRPTRPSTVPRVVRTARAMILLTWIGLTLQTTDAWVLHLALAPFLILPAGTFARGLATNSSSHTVGALAALLLTSLLAVSTLDPNLTWPGFGALLATLALIWLDVRTTTRPWLTLAGWDALRSLRGYQAFLTARSPLDPDAFDPHVAHAVALGVVDRWGQRFGDAPLTAPWLTPLDAPSAPELARTLRLWTERVQHAAHFDRRLTPFEPPP